MVGRAFSRLISDALCCFFTVISFSEPPAIVGILETTITLVPLVMNSIIIVQISQDWEFIILYQTNTDYQTRARGRKFDAISGEGHQFEERGLIIKNQ